ncbi:MAG: hypothetical protein WC444_03030 [Candidatus Paceibacterota bacterium]
MTEKLTTETEPIIVQEKEGKPNTLDSIRAYRNAIENKNASLETSLIGVADSSKRNELRERLKNVGTVGKNALAYLTLMGATSGAFGTEMKSLDVETLHEGPIAEASMSTEKVSPESKKEIMEAIDTTLVATGEAIEEEAEKLSREESSNNETPLNEDEDSQYEAADLPTGLVSTLVSTVDMKNPATLASLASKLGGSVGALGKMANYTKTSYDTLRAVHEKGEDLSFADTRKLMDVVGTFPVGSSFVRLVKLAGKAMDAKESLNKGEEITVGKVFMSIASLVPHAAILMGGINMLKSLPKGNGDLFPKDAQYTN